MASMFPWIEEQKKKERARAAAPATPRPATPKPKKKTTSPAPSRAIQGPPVPAPVAKRIRRRQAAAPSTRPAARPQKVDPEFAKLRAEVADYEREKKSGKYGGALPVQTAGFDPSRLVGVAQGRGPGGFLKNLGTGAVRMITDLPSGAQLAAEGLLFGAAAGTNAATGNSPVGGLNGRPSSAGAGFVRSVQNKTGADLRAAGQGIKADYAYRWGPLVRGDVKTFGSRFYDDPAPTIMDAAGVYSAAGRAPAAAARAGAAVTTGRTSERLARAGSRSRVAPGEIDVVTGAVSEKGGRLYRAPRRVEGRATGETPKGNVNTGSKVIEVPRRPYSPNVMTRAGQRGADKVRGAVTPRVERWAEARQPRPGEPPRGRLTRPLTQQGKFDRAVKGETRDIIFRREQQAAGVAGRDAAPFSIAVRKLKSDRNEAGVRVKGMGVEHIATRLHLEDVLSERAGLSAAQIRDRVVARMEEGLRKAEARGDRTDLTRRQIEQVKAIPDSLLTLKNLDDPQVARVVRAVEEGRKLDEISQGRAVRAGAVTAESAAQMRGRTSSLLLGGSEWAPALIKEMKAAGASKAERAAVRRSAIRETPKLAGMRARLADLEDRINKAKTSGDVTRTAKAEAKRDAYLKSVRAAEDREVGLTPPTRPELVSDKGVYIPKKPIDKMSTGSAFPRRRGMSGPQPSRRDKGYLTQKGGFDMNPALLAHQAQRAADAEVGPMSNAALNELVGIAAYLDDGGKMVSGQRAAQMARTDPDRVVLVHKGKLQAALTKLDELDEGKTLEPGDVKMFYGEGKESWLQAIPEGKISGEYVAISKAAADVWREAPTTVPALKAVDTLMDYWKGGILTLSPRWYVNSMIGVGTQYGLMAGLDIRSMRQAIRKGPIKESVPDEVVLNSLANDVGFKGKVDANKLESAFAAGFRTNNRIESAWRRAAYINRGKKALRDEGLRFRGMTDAEIARAIDSMPPSIARNVIRDVDLFMGEFRKFNSFERNVVKRVVPFYSWLRVISRLTFTLPFHSPIRVAALNTLGRAGQYGINPDDYARPIYERGALVIGKYRIPTTGMSSAATLVGPAQAVTKIAEDPSSALGQIGEESLAWARPEIQTALAATYGTNSFGGPVIAPSGYGGSVRGFGGAESIDPSTGLVESSRTRIPVDEALLQSFGAAPFQSIRRLASAGNRPFDTTRTLALLNARLTGGSTEGMFLDPSKRPYKKPAALGYGSILGINPHTENRAELLRRYKESQQEFKKKRKRQKPK